MIIIGAGILFRLCLSPSGVMLDFQDQAFPLTLRSWLVFAFSEEPAAHNTLDTYRGLM